MMNKIYIITILVVSLAFLIYHRYLMIIESNKYTSRMALGDICLGRATSTFLEIMDFSSVSGVGKYG